MPRNSWPRRAGTSMSTGSHDSFGNSLLFTILSLASVSLRDTTHISSSLLPATDSIRLEIKVEWLPRNRLHYGCTNLVSLSLSHSPLPPSLLIPSSPFVFLVNSIRGGEIAICIDVFNQRRHTPSNDRCWKFSGNDFFIDTVSALDQSAKCLAMQPTSHTPISIIHFITKK